jgi:hypothetical protein
MPGKILALVVALAVLLSLGPAQAFPEATLRSVVSVLPEWPGAGRRPEEPEGSGVAVLARAGSWLTIAAWALGMEKPCAAPIRIAGPKISVGVQVKL